MVFHAIQFRGSLYAGDAGDDRVWRNRPGGLKSKSPPRAVISWHSSGDLCCSVPSRKYDCKCAISLASVSVPADSECRGLCPSGKERPVDELYASLPDRTPRGVLSSC